MDYEVILNYVLQILPLLVSGVFGLVVYLRTGKVIRFQNQYLKSPGGESPGAEPEPMPELTSESVELNDDEIVKEFLEEYFKYV